MDKKTLKEIEDIITSMEAEARKNCKRHLEEGDHRKYSYWSGKRSALCDVSIEVGKLLRNL